MIKEWNLHIVNINSSTHNSQAYVRIQKASNQHQLTSSKQRSVTSSKQQQLTSSKQRQLTSSKQRQLTCREQANI